MKDFEFYKCTEEEDKLIDFLSSGDERNIMLALSTMYEDGCPAYIKQLIHHSCNAIENYNHLFFGNVADIYGVFKHDWIRDDLQSCADSICRLLISISNYKEERSNNGLKIGNGVFANEPALYDFRLFRFDYAVSVRTESECLPLIQHGIDSGNITNEHFNLRLSNPSSSELDLRFLKSVSLFIESGGNFIERIYLPELTAVVRVDKFKCSKPTLQTICKRSEMVHFYKMSVHEDFTENDIEMLWLSDARVQIEYEMNCKNAIKTSEMVDTISKSTNRVGKKKFMVNGDSETYYRTGG